ncbi:MAG: ATP-dependent DNA ligase [Candidatus Altiarchaeales archaeon]|nr:ATP-dependent DNA ligase [Candidatus Altiarchaeales archaeon]
MEFKDFAELCSLLDSKSGRIEMTDIIAGFLSKIPRETLSIACYFIGGEVFPIWQGVELGIAGKLMIKALSDVSGVEDEEIEKLIRDKGDAGLVAEQILVKKTQTTLFQETLTLEKVYDNLSKAAVLEGKGAQEKRLSYVQELLSNAGPLESRYLVRLVLGELRLGVGDGIIRDAIAKAFNVDVDLVERAYQLTSDLGEVAKTANTGGNEKLKEVSLVPMRPVKVMLAQKAEGLEETLAEFSPAAFEVKYDGARIQIHKDRKQIELYTRRLENVTKQFPEIVKSSMENINAESAIIEGEVVAIKSFEDRKPRPFQDLSRRIKRKYDISQMVKKIPVEVNLFDLIYINGESKLETPFRERRKLLEEAVSATESFRLSEQMVTDNAEQADEFYEHAISLGHEGVMIKNLDAPYQPGSRVGYMYKLKPVMESLDLIIIGAIWGEGKRAHWLASLLLSVYDPARGEFLEIGRLGTGLTDEQFQEMTELLKPLVVEEKGQEVKIKPKVVVEVAYEEIQHSPTYSSGYALRFPRLVRIRNDKGPLDTDTMERIEELMRK